MPSQYLFVSSALSPTLHATELLLPLPSGWGTTPQTKHNELHEAEKRMKMKLAECLSEKEWEQQKGTCGGRFRAALTTEDSQERQLQSRLVIKTASIALDFLSWAKLLYCENQDI